MLEALDSIEQVKGGRCCQEGEVLAIDDDRQAYRWY